MLNRNFYLFRDIYSSPNLFYTEKKKSFWCPVRQLSVPLSVTDDNHIRLHFYEDVHHAHDVIFSGILIDHGGLPRIAPHTPLVHLCRKNGLIYYQDGRPFITFQKRGLILFPTQESIALYQSNPNN